MDEEVSSFKQRLVLKIFTALLFVKVSQCSDSDVRALLAVKHRLNSDVLADWIGGNPCNWTGVECEGPFQRVVSLSLPNMTLAGPLDPAVGNLTSLREINLALNSFSGPIPFELGRCQALKIIDLSQNRFEGRILPLVDLKNLVRLNLTRNKLNGTIPSPLGTLKKLRFLDISSNRRLSGEIPDEIGNCTTLEVLSLSHNSLSGHIPPSLFQLTKLRKLFLQGNHLTGSLDRVESSSSELEDLWVNQNNLSGEIPEFLSNLSRLINLQLSANNLTGAIPSSLTSLSQLEILSLRDNKISGRIPVQIGRLSTLRELHIDTNTLEGSIPRQLFACRNLTALSLHRNRFTSAIPSEIGDLKSLTVLNLSRNRLTGSIPAELANCSHLERILLCQNYITGELPEVLSTLHNLSRLHVEHNMLRGVIPSPFSQLLRLEYLILSDNDFVGALPNNFSVSNRLLNLELANNQLTGSIPTSLTKVPALQKFDASGNQLSGNFSEISRIRSGSRGGQLQELLINDNNFTGEISLEWIPTSSLLVLDLHGNHFSGPIPGWLENSFLVQKIDLSTNQFSGPVPSLLGRCSFLTHLNLSFNRLTDEIPSDIADSWARGENTNFTVDLSNNNLSGQIPQSLNLPRLQINVSNNNLSGPIPPLLERISAINFLGNPYLCGLPLTGANCAQGSSIDKAHSKVIVGIIILVSIIGCCAVAVLGMFLCFKKGAPKLVERNVQVDGAAVSLPAVYAVWFEDVETCSQEEVALIKPPKLKPTLADLSRATEEFSTERIVGDGGYGTVYRGEMSDGSIVAIKRFTEDGCQGEREFVAELETLGNIRHKNLVRLLGHCSNDMDRLLVYEYMPNNSLDVWLYNRTEGMDPLPWQLRVVIALDVARGLAFLHHFCIPKVIHRDLKSSNILLDANFNAKLADFGLARHLNTYESHMSTMVAGTLGYIAPEYGQTWRATTSGDVFSFGIVLLELLSGRRPAGVGYKPIHGGNLVGWVRHLFRTNQISNSFFDETLGPVKGSDIEIELMTALEVGLRCTRDDPAKRPTMLDVLRRLEGKEGKPAQPAT